MLIDVIIPLYRPGEELFTQLRMLRGQSLPVRRVILMNTEERYFRNLIQGTAFAEEFSDLVEVHHVSKEAFDHGGTRRRGVDCSTADIFVMMTQDAMPVDEGLLEHLTAHLEGNVAVAYGRQLPREDSGLPERISRAFNYPDTSLIKGAQDRERLGIKTYFCSNVCAAYRRDVYEKLGGFVERAIFNEDMLYAAAAVERGYRIAYEAGACVIHSHNYTAREQLHRNFDLGVSQAQHPEVFGGIKSESEGRKLVRETVKGLREAGQLRQLPAFCLQCAGKYAGYLLGKHYTHLPRKMILSLTSNREFWK